MYIVGLLLLVLSPESYSGVKKIFLNKRLELDTQALQCLNLFSTIERLNVY